MFVPLLEPYTPQTHTVPGFRLGPGLRIRRPPSEFGLYTILPMPILYDVYCNTGGSGETQYCALVWAMGWGEWDA